MRIVTLVFGIGLILIGLVAFSIEYFPQAATVVSNVTKRINLPQFSEDTTGPVRIVSEESVVIDVVKSVGPSVVTIAAIVPEQSFENSPFWFFGFEQPEEEEDPSPENIGSGFVLSEDGLIVTNKHVVSNPEITYSIVTSDDLRYDITQIYRDPLNDIAVLKVDPAQHSSQGLRPVTLGDSDNLQVGQMAIAIGTPLGEFNNSVTKGIISGLGRGIVAGSPFEGFVERLDNVIQTDAAISPGNSGGPLLNSSGEVIGVNTAVSGTGENLGFALPINLVKEALETFNETGQFDRPYLGVTYRMISRNVALQNDVPEGALVQTIIEDSPADDAGIEVGDIITEVDGVRVTERDQDLAQVIAEHNVDEEVNVIVWRESNDGEDELTIPVRLGNATEQ